MAETRASSPPYPHGALPGGTRLGEFEIKHVLGVGGFGIVYLALDHLLEREVALKEYMPASLVERSDIQQVTLISQAHADTFALGLRSFVNEARLLARFDHPSLLKVHRFWEANGTAYMAMALYKGRTARDVRTQMTERPDEAWVRRLLEPLLGAIEKLHSEDVYHRDIAPDNILIESDGRPVLLDFGAARRVITDRSQALTAILKPSYAPIEQYADVGGMKQGPWTDIYALGATVHYLLMGKPPPPAPGRSIQDTMKPLAKQDLPGFSQSFLSLVDWMLSPLPAERPQSVAAVRDVLAGHAQVPIRQAPTPFERTAVLPGAGPLPLEDAEDATILMPRPPAAGPSARPAADVPDDATIIQPRLPPAPAPGQAAHRRPPPLAAAAAAAAAAPAAPQPAPHAPRAAPPNRPPPSAARAGASKMPLVLGGLAAVVVLAAGAWWWGQTHQATTPAAVARPGSATVTPVTTTAPPATAPLATAPLATAPATAPPAAASALLPAVAATTAAPAVAEPVQAMPIAQPKPATAEPRATPSRSTARPADATPTSPPVATPRRQEANPAQGNGQMSTGAAPKATPAAAPVTRPAVAPTEAATRPATTPRPTPTPAPAEPVAEARPASPSERCAKELPLVRLICVDLVCNRSEFKQHPECLTLRAEQAKKRMLEGQ